MDRDEKGCCEHFMRDIHCKQEMFEMFQIGVNAGLIWVKLMEDGPMTSSKLAVAMLADEDRVRECLYYAEAALLIRRDCDGTYGALED